MIPVITVAKRLFLVAGGSLMLLAIMPLSVQAGQIRAISLHKSVSEQVVSVQMDSSLDYQVFDLQAPPRVVLKFAGASLKADIQPLSDDSAGIKSIFPFASPEGARIEIGMDARLPYRIEEKGGKMILHFQPPRAVAAKTSVQAKIEDLEVHDSPQATELVLRGQHMDASHNASLINNGRVLILDLWGATSSLPRDHFIFSSRAIHDVTVGRDKGRLRLVVTLVPGASIDHRITATPSRLVLHIGKVSSDHASAVTHVEEVGFEPEDRIAHLIIRTDRTDPVINLREKGDHVIIDIRRANLNKGLERSLDVSQFPGPVRQIDAYGLQSNVRIVARLREKVRVSSFQSGNILTISFVPEDLASAKSGAKERFAYSGQKVTFDFKDIDIRNALKLIAEMSDLNIIMSDDVTGTLTMRLINVPWDQALDIILRARGLGSEKVGNVVRIAPMAVIQAENESKLRALKGSERLEPLMTEIISLNYARVEDMKKMFDDAISAHQSGANTGKGARSSGAAGLGLLTLRGSYLIDARTNTLIIKDTRKSIDNIKRLVATIDTPVQQVLIEARVVEASDSFLREFGIRWGGGFNAETGRNFPGSVAVGSGQTANPVGLDPTVSTGDNAGAILAGGTTAATGRGFLVDLPAAVGAGAGGAIGLSLGSFTNVLNLDLELSAAQADGDIKIISNPRVVTTNLTRATIEKGRDVPYVTTSQNGTQVEFRKATLSIEVTPQITADKHVILSVKVTKDSVSPDQNAQQQILDVQNVETKVFMNNGETVVIGGVYTRAQSTSISGIPLLMDIPVLGWLFKKKLVKDDKKELLIFLTPRIIEKDLARTEENG